MSKTTDYFEKIVFYYDCDVVELSLRGAGLTAFFKILSMSIGEKVFGVSNFLLCTVIATILIDAYFGVKKAKKKYIEAIKKQDIEEADLNSFDPKKLRFTFNKCFMLLLYLFVVKTFLQHDEQLTGLAMVVGISAEIVLKAPLALVWYYEFQSIGRNTEFLFGKKASIFKISAKIFQPKINNLLR